MSDRQEIDAKSLAQAKDISDLIGFKIIKCCCNCNYFSKGWCVKFEMTVFESASCDHHNNGGSKYSEPHLYIHHQNTLHNGMVGPWQFQSVDNLMEMVEKKFSEGSVDETFTPVQIAKWKLKRSNGGIL